MGSGQADEYGTRQAIVGVEACRLFGRGKVAMQAAHAGE